MFFCVTFLILYSFMECQSEQLQVVGPKAPLVAVTGEDLVLPCFIKPNTNALNMTVEWLRVKLGVLLVHSYRSHEDQNENQAQAYKGRTSLFKEELQKGNASLKLSALQVSDAGEYKCLVEDKSWYDDITVYVIVEVLGSHPVITVESYDNSGGINLVCESRGWNPEPQVQWLDREGVILTAEDTQIHRDTEGFSLKSHITVFDYSDSNRFYCRLQQKHHMIETHIIINTLHTMKFGTLLLLVSQVTLAFFVGKIFHAWKMIVGISVLALTFAVGLILTAVICHKKGHSHGEKLCRAAETESEK
ncbi:butyrophilin subfamily 1 member A1-like isoform X2 [Hemibagrus wyckioides]|uniref:butyrophilin subfamily 1 member A1-like isoform X2 n=1 Tax=Hemibagrus wyckioides TaxID=337641 RepID=UPI00266B50FA|nr:butyrophilin subfamily 1 member A1-like isoform X2 [Hemibagrus wyckioides]